MQRNGASVPGNELGLLDVVAVLDIDREEQPGWPSFVAERDFTLPVSSVSGSASKYLPSASARVSR